LNTITDILTNVTGANITVTYQITPTVNGGLNCSTIPAVPVTITVEPQPIIVAGQAKTICSGSAVNYHVNLLPAGLPSNTRFSWLDPDGAGPATAGVNVPESSLNTITDVLTNVTGANITVTYVITPTVNGGLNCTTLPAVPVTITVEPQPIIVAGQAKTICSGSAVNYHVNLLPAGLPSNTRFSWPDPDGAGPATAGTNVPESALNTITDILTNVTGASITVTYQITPTVNGGLNCSTIPAVPVTITVQSEPVGTPANLFACSDEAFSYNIQATSIDAGGNGVLSKFTFVVSSSDETNVPTPPLLDRTIATSAGLTGSFTNTTSGIVLITYTITPTNAIGLGCPGASFDVVYSIRPEPKGPATTTEFRCSGETNNFNLQTLVIDNVVDGNSVPSKFKYTVSSSNPIVTFPGANRTTATVANITDTYVNKSNVPVTITYTVTPVSLTVEECEGTPFDFKIVLRPEPVGSNVVDPACSSSLNHSIQSQITNGVSSVFTYTVSSSDPVGVPPAPNRVASSNAPITDNYSNLTGSPVTVTYTITPFSASLNNCQGSPFTYAVNISPKPQAGPFTQPAVCSNIPFTFNPQDVVNNPATTPAGNGVLSTFTWTVAYDPGIVVKTAGVSGNLISETLLNRTSGSTVLNAVYTIIPTAQGSDCVGLPFTITVPINPEPVMSPALANPTPVCSTNASSSNPISVTLNTNGSSVAAASYVVTLKSKDVGLVGPTTVGTFVAVAGSSSAIANDTYRNTTATVLKVVYTVVPVSAAPASCSGDPFDITVSINPEPVLAAVVTPQICSRDANAIILGTNGSSVTAGTYQLLSRTISPATTLDPGANILTNFPVAVPGKLIPDLANRATVSENAAASVGGSDLIKNDKFINTTNETIRIQYTIVAVSPAPASCIGLPIVVSVDIKPEPILAPGLATQCSGLPIGPDITLTGAAGSVTPDQFDLLGVNFGALIPAGTNAALGVKAIGDNTFLTTDIFTNTSNPPFSSVFYTIVPIRNGCRGPQQTVRVDVFAAPALSPSLSKTVCSGEASAITMATTGSSAIANRYNFLSVSLSGVGLTPNGSNAVIPSLLNNSTSYIISDRYTNTSNGPLTATYVIEPISADGCVGPAVSVVLTVEPTVTMLPPVQAALCSNSANSPSETNFVLNSLTVPTSGTITYNYTAFATPPNSVSGFFASQGNLVGGVLNPIKDKLVNNTNAVATVTYEIIPKAVGMKGGLGCLDVPPTILVVSVEPQPRLSITPVTQVICEGTPTTMALSSTTSPGLGRRIRFVKVSATPTGGMTLTSPAKINYDVGEQIGDIWDIPTDTIRTQTVTYVFRSQIEEISSGAVICGSDDITVLLTVNPNPTIVASAQAPICSSDFVNITLTPNVANTVATYTVSAPSVIAGENNGAGNLIFQTLFYNSATPNVANSDGPVTVNYTVTPSANNCTGLSIIVPVVVNPKPRLLGIPNTVNVCHGNSLPLSLTSNVIGANYTWKIDPPPPLGVTGAVDQLTPISSGINQVLTNTTGSQVSLTYTIKAFGPGATSCESDDKIVVVTIAPEIRAEFQNSDVLICRGSSEFLNVDISGQAPFTIVYSENGVNQPPITGAANIKVIKVTPSITTTYRIESVTGAFNNCAATFIGNPVTVSVAQLPVVSFNEGTVPDFNGATTVTYTNTSTPLDFSQFRYDWTFGIAGDATPVTLAQSGPGGIPVVYSSPGTKRVTLSATNKAAETAGVDCKTSDVFKNITINVVPLVASFEVNPKELCFPGTIKVTDVKTGAGNFPLIYKWEVLLGSKTVLTSGIRDIGEFTVTTPGTYLIRFQVEEPATGQVKIATPIQVIVYDKPLSTFDLRPDVVYVPDTEMSAINFSSGANGYEWTFGDGGTSDLAEPKYTYAIEGKYDVSLIAKFDHGNSIVCSDTLTRTIIAKQGGMAKIPNSFTPNPNGRSSTGTGGNGTFNDVFLPLIKGISNDSDAYNLQIYDRWGNLVFESTSSVVGWDGYNKDGKLMPMGVYVYKLTVRFSDSQRTTTVGDITMLY
jgi:gliding motility-associated-like protein